MADQAQAAPKGKVTMNTGVSIALVMALLAAAGTAIATSLRMENRTEVVAKVLESTQEDVGEIKTLLQRLSDGMQREISDLRTIQMSLRERITKLETILSKETK